MTTKFSIVIPTRSRAPYLQYCIEATMTAVDSAGCEAEVLVSDNASDDDTAEVVASFRHPSLRYVRRPDRLSMRANFEACLDDVTGTHVIYIGDDDAVLPNGLCVLRQVIEQSGADIVNWTLPGYSWPDPDSGEPGYLKIFPGKLSGRLRKVDADNTLERFRKGTFRSYHDGAVTYHGCISRKTIEKAREESEGTYFWCSSPDVFAAIHNLMMDGVDYRKLDLPISLGGASPRSNGRSGQRMSRKEGKDGATEFDKFITEAENDPFNGQLPTRCPSLSLITLDALLLALRFHGVSEDIDREKWATRVANEIASMTEQHRTECAKLAETLIGVSLPSVPRRPAKSVEAVPNPNKALRSWPARINLVGGTAMNDVSRAAAALDRICSLDTRWKGPPGIVRRGAHTLQTAWRSRQAVKALC